MAGRTSRRGLSRLGALVALLAVLVAVAGTAAHATSQQNYVLGMSNTLVGNGWREGMLCSIRAQATASGAVDKVIEAHRQTDTAGQIADIRNLISAGVDALIINPSNAAALKPIAAQANARGIKVVFVDQYVSAPNAYNATNDQVLYGRLGAEWLFKKLGGRGNVVEMRGIAGVPADTDRHKGFVQAKAKYPNIKVVKSVFTGWSYATGGKQMLDILNSGVQVNGVWTSGIDYTVVNAFKTAGKPYVPIVGADNAGYVRQMRSLGTKLPGSAVTNPSSIGGVGTAVAIRLLEGKSAQKWVKLKPQVWTWPRDRATINKFVTPGLSPDSSVQLQIQPWTTYTLAQYKACKALK
jgi:ribose transport system substrate-binding protein